MLNFKSDFASLSSLTDREHDVLRLIADGLPNKQIAVKLGVTAKTIEFHKTRIYHRLGVSGPILAVRMAIREGYLTA